MELAISPEWKRQFDDIVSRRLSGAERAEIDGLVQQGEANDAAVKRFEEYIELTANV